MCNNIFELAGNPFTIDTATELAPDPNYDGSIPTNWLQSVARWFNNLAVVKWYRGLSNGGKAAVGCVLFALSLILAFVTGGMSAAIQVTIEVAIGVGVGIGIWALSALATGQQLTLDGLATAALDSFVVSSLFAFVQQSINALKYACRLANMPEYSSEFLEWLNQGDANYSVYKAMDENGKFVYTGITKQSLAKRLYQHQRVGKSFDELRVLYNGLTRNQARSIETYKILTDGTSQVNKILSISKQHMFFDEAMRWARAFLGG